MLEPLFAGKIMIKQEKKEDCSRAIPLERGKPMMPAVRPAASREASEKRQTRVSEL